MYAAVLIRSLIGVRTEVKDTLSMLRIRKKHVAVLIDEQKMPNALGMLEKCKDCITYGPVSEGVAQKLQARMDGGVAHLAPPRGGFERKGIKKAYAEGGALGKRDSMDKLLEAML
jgi:large subunit ribosomal protein L30